MNLFPCHVLHLLPNGDKRIGLSGPAPEHGTLRYREINGSGLLCNTYIGETKAMTRLIAFETFIKTHAAPSQIWLVRQGKVYLGKVTYIDTSRSRVFCTLDGEGGLEVSRLFKNAWVVDPVRPDVEEPVLPIKVSQIAGAAALLGGLDYAKVEARAMAAVCDEETLLRAAGAKRGFILWNPAAKSPPQKVYSTYDEALKVQAIMAERCKNQGVFYILPLGPGLGLKTITTTEKICK